LRDKKVVGVFVRFRAPLHQRMCVPLFMMFLRHRVGITYEAEAENITSVDIINKIINEVEVP
jgi:hypothetical protein